MNTVEEYIHKLNSKSHILSKEEFEKNTALKYYCPVIDTEVARFLQIIIQAIRPKNILELGTSIGYSTTMMAFAADKCGAKITAIEKDRAAAYAAQKNIKKYKVDHIISLINEDVFSILPKLKQEYDLLFLDLYNGLYPEVLDGCIDALKIGGMLIADDTLFPITQKKVFFENSNKKIEEFNKVLSKRNDMNSFLLPLDDGITIAIKQ